MQVSQFESKGFARAVGQPLAENCLRQIAAHGYSPDEARAALAAMGGSGGDMLGEMLAQAAPNLVSVRLYAREEKL